MNSFRLAACAGAMLTTLAAFPAALHAQTLTFFSSESRFTPTGGPFSGVPLSDGDLLASSGHRVRSNGSLLSMFCFKPVVPDMGLDALHVTDSGLVLFSTETANFDECNGVLVSPGDLLSSDGDIVRTNAQLLVNFHPKPVAPDVGLDAIHLFPSGDIWFSIETDLFDEQIGDFLHHGDVLSDAGVVVSTNRELMRNFCPKPVFGDMGLDALYIPNDAEIWFSTEDGWFDECRSVFISDGDLLSSAGYIVATNEQLVSGFFATDPVPPVGLDAVHLPSDYRACGRLAPGPQGCVAFIPESDAATLLFIENSGGFGVNERVFVRGVLNPQSLLCAPFVRPGIEDNQIYHCFEACGTLRTGPQGCPQFVPDGVDQGYFLANTGEFAPGDHVYVRGGLNPESSLCLPFTAPGIEGNTISRCLSACGRLQPGPQGCTVFVPENGDIALFVENTGEFGFGDRVFVRGPVNPESGVCPPFTAPAVEDNVIGECFSGCGLLVQGVECVLLRTQLGDELVLDNQGAFVPGDRVYVRGLLERVCFTPCLQGDGCVQYNEIAECRCPCDWNGDQTLNSQDFFDFLRDFFSGRADFNFDRDTNSQDFFDFLTCFFGACP